MEFGAWDLEFLNDVMYRASSGRTLHLKGQSFRQNGGIAVRARIATAGLFAFAVLLIVRLFILQIVDADVYRALASEQREIYQNLFPERGEILIQESREGGFTALATNKDLFLVYADPRLIDDPQSAADRLAPLLGIGSNAECRFLHQSELGAGQPIQSAECAEDEYQELLGRLSKHNDPYEPLKHGVEESVVEEIQNLHIAGVEAAREAVRFYPFKNIGAHIAGFVGSDGDKVAGRYGIEGLFDSELAGVAGFFEGERDLAGRWIPVGKREFKSAVDGSTLVLTIDRAVEHTACNKLNEAVALYDAQGGSAIVMDVKTGAILAMCGSPDFDPNEYSKVEDISIYNNPAIFAQYEPGSVFKIITMAAALDTGAVTPEMAYEDKGEVVIDPYTIKNSDLKSYGLQTMAQVLEKSLNTGAIFAAQKVGIERFRDYVERFGFGKKTGIELQGEASGEIESIHKRGKIYLATASFGQGISVTLLQLAQAVGAIANQGKMMKPYLVREIRDASGTAVRVAAPEIVREVISPRTATLLSGMMVSVVEKGHGKRAAVPGYYVAGKTGTAQIPRKDGKGYEQDVSIGTFAGFGPVEDPKFVIVVRIDRPAQVRFAESTAAPLFGDIAKFLIQYFEIKPTRSQ